MLEQYDRALRCRQGSAELSDVCRRSGNSRRVGRFFQHGSSARRKLAGSAKQPELTFRVAS
jgi:hypothetical protein